MLIKKIIAISMILLYSTSNAQSDFEIVKQRVVNHILSRDIDDLQIDKIMSTINENGTWPDINYDDVSRTGFDNRRHLDKMVELAIAFNKNDSKYHQNKELLDAIINALNHWCEQDYVCDNWWFNQIYTPKYLLTILLLMDEQIPNELVSKGLEISERSDLNSGGSRPGGDRIKIGSICAMRGLVVGDENRFKDIMIIVNNEIKFNTGDRGMQHDYSFHHRIDRVNNTISYGLGYADVFAEWAEYVAGTEYAFSEEKIRQLVDYYLDGICKQFVYGIYSSEKGAKNRSISRRERFRPAGVTTPKRLLAATNYRQNELTEIVALRSGEEKPSQSFCQFYWQSEHFVFQRPHFYTTVRMYSTRNANMEAPYNSEGLKNHHRGDGTNYLSIKGDEYLNMWPMADWQKIPGATVLQKPELPGEWDIQKYGVTNFVGAVTDGHYGAVGFDFTSPHDFIKAKKSWFFFDDEYVCLGAGIESDSRKLPVVTTVNQTLLNGNVVVKTNSQKEQLDKGEHVIENISWVHHDNVGYVFPEPTTINLNNKSQSGRWFDINKQSSSSKKSINKDIFTLWIDHGPRPQGRTGGFINASMLPKDVTYQYIVVPGVVINDMGADRGIEILSNTKKIQAVKNEIGGIVQAVFYEAGELFISPKKKIEIDSPGIVMLKINDDKISQISVADPSRNLGKIHIYISGKIVETDDETFTSNFDPKANKSHITIKLPDGHYKGNSVTIKL